MRTLGFISMALLAWACNSSNDSLVNQTPSAGIPAGASIERFQDSPGLERATVRAGEKIVSHGDFLNGQHHGTWTEYHTNGSPKSITTYINGLKEGYSYTFSERGELETAINHHNNRPHGEAKTYKRAKVVVEKVYINGLLEGKIKKYYDNGKIMEESNFQQGKMHGKALWYDQEGNVTIEYEYDNGTLIKK